MRILFLTYNLIPPNQPGSIRAWQVASFLVRSGHDVIVVTSNTHYMTGSVGLKSAGGVDNLKALTVKRVASPIKNPRQTKWHRIMHDTMVAFRQLLESVKEIQNVDLVLSASPPILTPLTACLLSRMFSSAHIFEVRDMLAEGLKAGKIIRNKAFIAVIDKLERFCFTVSDGLIAVTPGIKRLMLGKGVPEANIKLITNGVEDELYELLPDSKVKRKEWNVPDDAFIAFFSGTLSTFSNVGLLLEAARLCKDTSIHFLIAGEGQKRTEYEAYCTRHRLNNVRFLGAQPRAEIPGLCVMSDICVHMFKEGPFWDIFFSNKMFDYMGAGRPVVYSGGGDSADLVRRSEGGVVVRSEDPVALSNGILYLYENPDKRKQLGGNAREYVMEHYSRKKLLCEMERYLKNVSFKISSK